MLLRVEVESKVSFLVKVKVQLKIEDNEFNNLNVSHTPYVENVFANDARAIAILQKIDPTRDCWGTLSLSFSVKRPSGPGYASSTVTTSANWGANGSALRTNILAAHMGTGFFKAT